MFSSVSSVSSVSSGVSVIVTVHTGIWGLCNVLLGQPKLQEEGRSFVDYLR